MANPPKDRRLKSLNSTYDGEPDRYDELRTCWLNQRRAAFIAGRIGAWSLPPNASVLEIGSGTGLLLRELATSFPTLQFFGLEPQPEYVEYSVKRSSTPNLRFLQGTAEEAGTLFDSKFAAVLSNDVLHHVESVPHTIRSISRISLPGCRWLAIEPNVLNPYAFLGQSLKSGERNFWPRDYVRETRAFGWFVETWRYIFAVPPFVHVTPPKWIRNLELSLEQVPFVGGGVCLELRR